MRVPPISLRQGGPDVVLGVLGVAFGWASFLYPFGRDQGLYFYVAREWVLRGSVPYRDVLDHKTPGIYILHALSVGLFGEAMWGIRVLDFLCVIALGLAAGSLTTARGTPIGRGVRGAAILSLSVLFYGFLDFWNTSQSEIWYAMLGTAAAWAAYRLVDERHAARWAGVLSGAAVVMKPPAAWFVLVAIAILAWRMWGAKDGRARRYVVGVLGFAGGAALVPTIILVYFAAKGALPAMIDVVVGANSYYVTHEAGVLGKQPVLDAVAGHLRWYDPFSVVLPLANVLGVVAGAVHRRRPTVERNALALLLLAAGYAAVAMQGKFYVLHWAAVLGAETLLAMNLALNLVELLGLRAGWITYAAAAVILYATSAGFGRGARVWAETNADTIAYLRGTLPREKFLERFQIPEVAFSYEHSDRVGRYLAEHTKPDDYIAVRGFQPEMYAIAKRRYPGRFFWTTFLVNPARAYRRDEWLAEDADALARHPPIYVVTITGVQGNLDSTDHFLPMGYEVEIVMGEFTVMRRR